MLRIDRMVIVGATWDVEGLSFQTTKYDATVKDIMRDMVVILRKR